MALMDEVEQFCQELRPIEDLCYLERKFNDQVLPLAKKHNLLALPVEKRYGGQQLDSLTLSKVMMRLAREGAGIRTFFSVHSELGQRPIQKFGSEHLKKRYLLPSVKGDCILAFALTEPEAGSDPLAMQASFKETQNGYVLNGVKYLISNSGIAHAIIVFAKGPSGKVSAFVIDTDKPGFLNEDLHAKMGMYTTNTGMFELQDYLVPKENVLGKLDDGWSIAKYALMGGRLSVAAGAVGVMEDSLEEAVRFAKERIQHKKPIAKHQLIQEHIAAIKLHIESSRLMVERGAGLVDQYERAKTEEAFRAADNAVAEAKLFAAAAAWDACDRAVQILGGRGWSFLYRPGRHLVDTRVCRIYEGAEEVLKLKVAESVLGREFSAFS